MKIKTLYLAAILSVCLTACSKEEEQDTGRLLVNISGSYSNSDSEQYKTFRFDLTYDELGRIASMTYTGDLYIYGEGFIRAEYTYTVDRNGTVPEVTLETENALYQLLSGWEAYEGIPQRETLPLTFDDDGYIVSITGRDLWFHVENTTLEYDGGGYLTAIREDDGAYYKTAVRQEWTDGNLVSQTHQTLNDLGEVVYGTARQFAGSALANDYAIDLNWLIGDLGLNRQNGLAMLGAVDLCGNRSPYLIGSTTEDDGAEWPVAYTLNENNTIRTATVDVAGSVFTYRFGYE